LKKWQNNLKIVGHPIRLSILIILYGAEIIDQRRKQKEIMSNFPRGFIQYYFRMIKSAIPVIRTGGFSVMLYYLAVWPVKFFIYLKMGKGILLPFSVKK